MASTDQPTSPAPQPAQPVLCYATPQADGLPEWHAQAEALIDQRAPLRKLRPFFARSDDAVRYFARSMQRRHAPQHAGQACIICSQPAADWWVVCSWTAHGVPRFAEIRISSEPTASFNTCHALCEPCGQRWLNRPWLNGLHWIARWSWMTIWLAVGVVWISRYLSTRGMQVSYGGIPWLFAIPMLHVAIHTTTRLIWHARIPKRIRSLLPRRRVYLGAATTYPQNPADPPFGLPFGEDPEDVHRENAEDAEKSPI